MQRSIRYIIHLDDPHASDPLFLQSLGRALALAALRPAPIIVHGSAEVAELLLEAEGIFHQREGGVIPIQSLREHQLVERAGRHLNQQISAILNEAALANVAVFGTQRRALVVEDGRVHARDGAWIAELSKQGVTPIVAAFARDAEGERSGEVPLVDAELAIAHLLHPEPVEVVIFTRTNLPGIMEGGRTIEQINIGDPKIVASVSDRIGMEMIVNAGYSVLLTNTTRLADRTGPVGTHVRKDHIDP